MEPTLGATVCLICFEMTETPIFVPSDAQGKLFTNCNKYLHSTLNKDTLKDIQLTNENQVPLCKSCFASAVELTQLTKQLTTIENNLSDLSVSFSMTVFHRRSQVYNIGQSYKTSTIIEFNEACLPPNLFSTKHEHQNIQHNNSNQEMDNSSWLNHAEITTNVKIESSDTSFDNLPKNSHPTANTNAEIQFNNKDVDKECGPPTFEQNPNIVSRTEMRMIHATGGNDSKKCADPKKVVNLTMSELLKSVKMPQIIIERIKTVGNKFGSFTVKSNQTKCEPRQKIINATFSNDDEFCHVCCTLHSFVPTTAGNGNILKCFYCEKAFVLECQRNRHHKTHVGDQAYKSPSSEEKFADESNQMCEKGHSGEKPYKCAFCEKKFNARFEMKTHERTHTGEKPFECSLCKKNFAQLSTLNQHKRTHTREKPFECSLCKKTFSQLSILNYHKITHAKEKPFKCSFCGQCFSRKYGLIDHERRHTGEKPYKCSHCEKTFITLRSKQNCQRGHKEQMLPSVDQFCNQNDNSAGDAKVLNCLRFKCSICNKRFKYLSNLKVHETIHTGEQPFKCTHCEKECSTLHRLQSHESTHTGVKPFECSLCKKKFSQSSALNQHKKTHREKPFECSFCGCRISRKRELKDHERLHTGEKPYKCLYCEKTFRTLRAMNNCQRQHKEQIPTSVDQLRNQKDDSIGDGKVLNGLRFKCSFCNKRFGRLGSLKHHERIHTGEKPFECSFCQKKFAQSSTMIRHKRTHTGEKAFECSFCGYKSARKCDLKVHERLHTGEKPYHCLYCEKTFRGLSGMNKHQKSHREQMSSLINKSSNKNSNSRAHLNDQEEMHSTFSNGQDHTVHEKTDEREDETTNENFIVGI